MRKLISFLLIAFINPALMAQYLSPGYNKGAGASTPSVFYAGCSAGTTSGTVSSSGYTFEVVESTTNSATNAITDSNSTVLTDLTDYGVGPYVKISYHVISGGTVTNFTAPNATAFCVYFATVLTTFDSGTDQGNTANTGTTCMPYVVLGTPTAINPGAGHVVFTTEGGSVTALTTPVPTVSNTGPDTYSVGTGFVPFNPGVNYGGASAYAILTGSTIPVWNWVTAGSAPCVEGAFH